MKIRTGFVSNSSSSSFVCVFPTSYINEYEKEEPVGAKLLKYICKTSKLDSIDVSIIQEFMSSGGYGTYDDFEGPELTEHEQEEYEQKFDNYPGEVTYHFTKWMKINNKENIISDLDW